jgi:hypothetical protein
MMRVPWPAMTPLFLKLFEIGDLLSPVVWYL